MNKDLKVLENRKKAFVVSGNNLIGFLQGLVESFEFEDEREQRVLELQFERVCISFGSVCDRVEDIFGELEDIFNEID